MQWDAFVQSCARPRLLEAPSFALINTHFHGPAEQPATPKETCLGRAWGKQGCCCSWANFPWSPVPWVAQASRCLQQSACIPRLGALVHLPAHPLLVSVCPLAKVAYIRLCLCLASQAPLTTCLKEIQPSSYIFSLSLPTAAPLPCTQGRLTPSLSALLSPFPSCGELASKAAPSPLPPQEIHGSV